MEDLNSFLQPAGSTAPRHSTGSLGDLVSPASPPRVNFKQLRQEISIEQVLELLAWRPVSRSGMQLRGPCPIHKSASPESRSLSVNLHKNAFQCFGCGKKGNQLDLYAFVMSLPLYAAAGELLARASACTPAKKSFG